MPTWLVKRHSDILAPDITDICNALFQQLKLHWCCKTAIIRPRLKKRTLDPNDLGSYRPISSLGFLSKVVEKVVDARLAEHVSRHRLLSVVQSAYRPFHSTETAIVRVVNDMISVVDQGHIGALMLLDLSTAFDTVDHSILMEVLKRRFGVEGNALGWLPSFFVNAAKSSVSVRVNRTAYRYILAYHRGLSSALNDSSNTPRTSTICL